LPVCLSQIDKELLNSDLFSFSCKTPYQTVRYL
jgi:hypothetical protein